ncbi:MAG TPA: hypothetical protein VGJ21_02460 [Terracidiphilus sp.]|jgi:hypothetical protein
MRAQNPKSNNPSSTHCREPLPDDPPAGFDSRVARILRDADCAYRLLNDGTFVVTVSLPDGRSHVVMVYGTTERVGTREMRHVFTCGFTSQEPLPADLANRLLLDNSLYRVAAWQLVNDGESLMALLSACLPADAEPEDLLGTIAEIAHVADRIEAEFTGDDCF